MLTKSFSFRTFPWSWSQTYFLPNTYLHGEDTYLDNPLFSYLELASQLQLETVLSFSYWGVKTCTFWLQIKAPSGLPLTLCLNDGADTAEKTPAASFPVISQTVFISCPLSYPHLPENRVSRGARNWEYSRKSTSGIPFLCPAFGVTLWLCSVNIWRKRELIGLLNYLLTT